MSEWLRVRLLLGLLAAGLKTCWLGWLLQTLTSFLFSVLMCCSKSADTQQLACIMLCSAEAERQNSPTPPELCTLLALP